MFVLIEHDCGLSVFAATDHPVYVAANDYYRTAKAYGLTDEEIAEDLGGYDMEDGNLIDFQPGFFAWSGGCQIINGHIVLCAPWRVPEHRIAVGLDDDDLDFLQDAEARAASFNGEAG